MRVGVPVRGMIVALVAGVGGVAVPPPAVAGTYDVHACNAAVAGGANNAFYSVASSGMTAYAECPAGQGITARNAWDNGTSRFLDGAYMIFDAPGGNVVQSISYESGWQRHDCSWGVGLIASGYDLGGTRVWGLPPGVDCGTYETPGPTSYFALRWDYAINTPRVRIESRCGMGSCPRNGVATMRIRSVVVRVGDDAAPTLTAGRGPLWTSDGWLGGMQNLGFDAMDAAGIRDLQVTVDGKQVASRTFGCDYTRPAPCANRGLEEPVDTTRMGGDGAHTLTLTATDAAGNQASASRSVRVDNTAPDAPRDLVVDGGEGWRSTNAFDLRWTNPPQAASPIAAVEYEVCPVAGSEKCVRGAQSGPDIAAIKALALPAPGEYTLRAWLRDAAGNHDARIAASPVRLRYDDASPEVALQPLTAEDPTRVVAEVSDRGSGVASGAVEMRRRGTEEWAKLATAVDGSRLVARIDDERLGDGLFQLRARAVDHAGNERSTSLLTDGRVAEVTLPLRLKTVLRAGVVMRRSGRRARLARAARVRYGRLVRVSGRVTSPEGNPLAGLEVQAFTQVRDGITPERLIAKEPTSRTGRFSFLIPRGPSRTVRIRYAGAPQVRSATRRVILHVRSRSTLRTNRRSFSVGQIARFRGKVVTGRIPASGKLVELQVKIRGRWRTFATTRTGRRGGWRYGYPFDGTTGRVTYRFRARVPREAGYPFVTGNSRIVRVKVRGL